MKRYLLLTVAALTTGTVINAVKKGFVKELRIQKEIPRTKFEFERERSVLVAQWRAKTLTELSDPEHDYRNVLKTNLEGLQFIEIITSLQPDK